MTKTLDAVVDKFACPDCKAVVGEFCYNKHGEQMPRLVHPRRMLCPVCEKPYAERSGNGFRHWTSNGNVWHRLISVDKKGTVDAM